MRPLFLNLWLMVLCIPVQGARSQESAGSVHAGQALFAVCTACPGAQGEGNTGLSSPRLIRMDDWYLISQLAAYLQGVRGTHRDDVYGQQMVPVMGVLTDEQAILDVVAYISSLNQP